MTHTSLDELLSILTCLALGFQYAQVKYCQLSLKDLSSEFHHMTSLVFAFVMLS
jgi:hypothetical protein